MNKKLIFAIIPLLLLTGCTAAMIKNSDPIHHCKTPNGYIVVEVAGEDRYTINYYNNRNKKLGFLHFPVDKGWQPDWEPVSFDGEVLVFVVRRQTGGMGTLETSAAWFAATVDTLTCYKYEVEGHDHSTSYPENGYVGDKTIEEYSQEKAERELQYIRQLLHEYYTPEQAGVELGY